jgi:hypothetical protein|tara:strand:- start:708 stop:1901 length:1194 start_codon:yes stop_codon:yes gene_type:complete
MEMNGMNRYKVALIGALLGGVLVLPTTTDAVTVPGNERIAATTDPVLVSVQLSQHFISDSIKGSAVVLGRADVFADNLGGSALAGARRGVMLLTDGGDSAELRPEVRTEINRVLVRIDGPTDEELACRRGELSGAALLRAVDVFILGGTAAVSQAVQDTLVDDRLCVKRLGGADRFETALAIAEAVRTLHNGFNSVVMVARADNPVDSAAAGALASWTEFPIVLTPSNALAPVVSDYLFTGESTIRLGVIMLGGPAALSSEVENAVIIGVANSANENFFASAERLAGEARDTTAVKIGERYLNIFDGVKGVSVVIVNGYLDGKAPQADSWVYALTAGSLAWRENIVVVYVRQDRVDTPTCDFIARLSPPAVKVLGPTTVVSDAAFDQARLCSFQNQI